MADILSVPLTKLKELVGRVIPTEGEPAQRVYLYPEEAIEINAAMGGSNTRSPLVLPFAIVKEQWEGNAFRAVSVGAGRGFGCNQFETVLSVIIVLYRGFLEDMVKPAQVELWSRGWFQPFYNEIQTDKRTLGGSVLRVGYAESDTIFEQFKGQMPWGEHIIWGIRYDLPTVISI